MHSSTQGFAMAVPGGGGVGASSPTPRSDLAVKGSQMRRGSLAELAVQESFGNLSTSPRRVGKTRLRGLQYSHRLRWADVLRADQPDSWAQGLLVQAQRVTPN